MWLFILRCAILYILHTPVSLVQAYCWEPGKNPYFTGPPVVKQVDLQTVRVSWLGLIEMRECADQFLVKYWQKINPQDYQLTGLVNQQVNSIDIKVSPKVDYQFQAVAREDKGSVIGVDWNKSEVTDFRTSAYNTEVIDKPQNSKDINQLDSHAEDKNDVNPSLAPTSSDVRRQEGEKGPELVLSIELIAIIVVCCVVFLLIVVGIVYKLACAQKSGDDIEDGDDEDDEDDDDDEDDIPEKEKFEA